MVWINAITRTLGLRLFHHSFWQALLSAGLGGLGGLFGGRKTEMVNPNIWGMNPQQRTNLADRGYSQMMGMYASDPDRYWGRDSGPGGFSDKWLAKAVMGMGPGGMGFGGGGVSSGGGPAHATASLIDMSDEAMQMLPSERIRQNVVGQLTRSMNAQTSNRIREMTDRRLLGGYGGGPAAEYLRQQAAREGLANIAEGGAGFESAFSQAAGGRRAMGLQTNAQLGTQTSIANAGFAEAARARALSASAANAQLGAAGAAQRSQAAQFLLGLGQQREGLDFQRYMGLHGMNMDWQRPQAQQQVVGQQPNMFSRIAGGVGAGLNLYGQLQDSGIFGGGGGGYGGGGGGEASGYIGNYTWGAPVDAPWMFGQQFGYGGGDPYASTRASYGNWGNRFGFGEM